MVSTDRWKSIWNKRKDCLRMKESVGWTSSRLTICLLHLKRPQLNRVVQVLTAHCNLRYSGTMKLQVALNLFCVQNLSYSLDGLAM